MGSTTSNVFLPPRSLTVSTTVGAYNAAAGTMFPSVINETVRGACFTCVVVRANMSTCTYMCIYICIYICTCTQIRTLGCSPPPPNLALARLATCKFSMGMDNDFSRCCPCLALQTDTGKWPNFAWGCGNCEFAYMMPPEDIILYPTFTYTLAFVSRVHCRPALPSLQVRRSPTAPSSPSASSAWPLAPWTPASAPSGRAPPIRPTLLLASQSSIPSSLP